MGGGMDASDLFSQMFGGGGVSTPSSSMSSVTRERRELTV